MTWRDSLVAALVATLAHPRWWLLALAAFLVRGGLLVVLLPIIALPSVAGLMSFLAPTAVGEVISGGPGTPVAVLAIVIALGVTAFVWIAGSLGTWFEAALIDEAAGADEPRIGPPDAAPPERQPGLGPARLGPHVLTGAAFVFAAARIFAVAYREATTPGAPTTPFVVRVVQGAPEAVIVLLVAWVLAEVVGGLALRELLLRGPGEVRSARSAIVRGARELATVRGLVTFVIVNLGVVVVAAPGWLAAGHAWDQLRILLAGGGDGLDVAIGLGLFLAVAFGGGLLLGVALAWRATTWTALVVAPDRHAAAVQGVGGVTLGPE